VGLPGETIAIHDNQVFIDGQPLEERYLDDVVQRDYGPQEVPEGHIFVLGDNRNASNDSRYFGAVSFDQIIGRAWISYWPPSDLRLFR
jgi:signal peptidase I